MFAAEFAEEMLSEFTT